jgi:hypothetical protein
MLTALIAPFACRYTWLTVVAVSARSPVVIVANGTVYPNPTLPHSIEILPVASVVSSIGLPALIVLPPKLILVIVR